MDKVGVNAHPPVELIRKNQVSLSASLASESWYRTISYSPDNPIMTLSADVNLRASAGVKRVPKEDTSSVDELNALESHPSSSRIEGSTSILTAFASVVIMRFSADTKARKTIALAAECRSPGGVIYGTTIVSPD